MFFFIIYDLVILDHLAALQVTTNWGEKQIELKH